MTAAGEALALLAPLPRADRSGFGGFAHPLLATETFRGWALCWSGRFEEAEEWLEKAVARAARSGNASFLAIAHAGLAQLAEAMGRRDMWRAQAWKVFQLCEELGTPRMRNLRCWIWGRSLLSEGKFEEARALFEQFQAVAEARRITLEVEGINLAGLARAQLGCGRYDDACRTARRAVETSIRTRMRAIEALARIEHAHILLVEPPESPSAIAESLDRAGSLIDQTGAEMLRPSLHVEYARLAFCLGDAASGEAQLRAAHQKLIEMGATARAEQIVSELRPPSGVAVP